MRGPFRGVFEFDTGSDTVNNLIVLMVVLGKGHYVLTAPSVPFNGNHKTIASSLKRLLLMAELWFNLGPSTDFVVADLVQHCD